MSMVFMSAFSLVRALEVEEPAGRGLDPFLHRVFVEDESLVGAGDAPGAGRHLGVELARAPPGVTQTEDCPTRTDAAGVHLDDPLIVNGQGQNSAKFHAIV